MPAPSKKKKKFSRKDLKKPDEFVARGQQIGEWLGVHRRKLLIGLGVLLGVLVVAAALYISVEERNLQSSRHMNDALSLLGRPVHTAALFSGSSTGGDEESFASLNEKDRASREAFEEARENASARSIRRMAALGEARAALSLGDYEEAEELYRSFVDDPAGAETFLYLAYEGLGMALEGQGELEEAALQYRMLEGVRDGEYTELSLYHQARVLEQQGEKEQARAIYERLARRINEAPEMTPLLGYIQDRIAGKEGVPAKPAVKGYGEPGMIMGPDGQALPTPGAGGEGLTEEQMQKLRKMLEDMKTGEQPPGPGQGPAGPPPPVEQPPPATGSGE
jgi:tetratricopeptide (TPR) repeat protein